MSASAIDESFDQILRGQDASWPLGPYVEAVLDIERYGRWVRVSAILDAPDPESGLHRVTVRSIRGVGEGGEILPISTEEVRALADRFERAYYRWRDRGVRKS